MIVSIGKRKTLDDAGVVSEIQKHNERAAETFYNECKKYFMSSYRAIFSREDIKEDIFQQSFVKLWIEIETGKIFLDEHGNMRRLDRHGNVRALTCNLRTFLIDIAKNDYRDWLRHDRLTLEDDFESFAHMVEVRAAVRPEEPAETIREQIVSNCVSNLPPRCREILTMFYYKNMKLDEIIVARGEKNISKNGLKTGKYKCMESLKSKVREMYGKYNLR